MLNQTLCRRNIRVELVILTIVKTTTIQGIKHTLGKTLLDAGLKPSEPTLVCAEGILPYLPEEGERQLVREFLALHPGNKILADRPLARAIYARTREGLAHRQAAFATEWATGVNPLLRASSTQTTAELHPDAVVREVPRKLVRSVPDSDFRPEVFEANTFTFRTYKFKNKVDAVPEAEPAVHFDLEVGPIKAPADQDLTKHLWIPPIPTRMGGFNS